MTNEKTLEQETTEKKEDAMSVDEVLHVDEKVNGGEVGVTGVFVSRMNVSSSKNFPITPNPSRRSKLRATYTYR